MKVIVENIVKRANKNDKIRNNLSFIKVSEENTIKENMRKYFRGQDENKLKIKLFFNRWSQILQEEKDNDEEILLGQGRAQKEKDQNYNLSQKLDEPLWAIKYSMVYKKRINSSIFDFFYFFDFKDFTGIDNLKDIP